MNIRNLNKLLTLWFDKLVLNLKNNKYKIKIRIGKVEITKL